MEETMTNMKTVIVGVVVVMTAFASWGAGPNISDISLPTPRREGGKPLMQALKERHTACDFSAKKLSAQVLFGLLWAAFGVNRRQSAGVGKTNDPLGQELAGVGDLRDHGGWRVSLRPSGQQA